MGVDDIKLSTEAFRKEDETDDALFYAPARFVTHIDAAAAAVLTDVYRATLAQGGNVLDLMSSWVSHLPDDMPFASVLGHGMNEAELAANPRLSSHFIQDLNRQPILPLESEFFDAALCCVGVQYLQNPVAVFAEVRRVMRPGAPFVVSFSNRCFATKAVAIWRALDDRGRAALVRLYLERAGFVDIRLGGKSSGSDGGDPLVIVMGAAPRGRDAT